MSEQYSTLICNQQWGITPPISTTPPTQLEFEQTEKLINTLQKNNLFETEQDNKKRTIVLEELDKMVKEFVYRVSKQKGFSETMAKEAGGKIFTFGSYRLGVHDPGSDIDVLCVFPKHVERDHFFTIMRDMLLERPEVTDLTDIAEAFVPVIKLRFSNIPIDFVCARVELSKVPDDLQLSDNNILKGLDDRCIRSINGSRVTNEILKLVPNIPTFRIALRSIKLWAKKKGIYSNMMGFLGGVAWAMLVAKICQYYPNACASIIISRFFRIFQQWEWPEPILLKPIEDDSDLHLRVWNPKLYPTDKYHRMPIITPTYPSMCATHNVTDSTKKLMIQEFTRARDIVDNFILQQDGSWQLLFDPLDFFQEYSHYIKVVVGSTTSDVQLKWRGLAESKIRQLVLKLELIDKFKLVHPCVKGVDKVHYTLNYEEKHKITHGETLEHRSFDIKEELELELEKEKKVEVNTIKHMDDIKNSSNLSTEELGKLSSYYTTCFYIGLVVDPISSSSSTSTSSSNDNDSSSDENINNNNNINTNNNNDNNDNNISTIKKYDDKNNNRNHYHGGYRKENSELSWPVNEFLKLMTSWDIYNEKNMTISLINFNESNSPTTSLLGKGKKLKRPPTKFKGNNTKTVVIKPENPSKKFRYYGKAQMDRRKIKPEPISQAN